MVFFRKYKGRGSYNLFSNYAFYLPDLKGMIILFLLFIMGSLFGSILDVLFVLGFSGSEAAATYSFLISYPVSFIPALLYASVQSRRNEMFDSGYALDNSNFGPKGGAIMAIIVSIATATVAFLAEPVNMLLPDMPESLEAALKQVTEGPIIAALLSVSVMAPLFEEWLCRGLVLRGLLKKMKPGWAIALSAAFFAVLHMNPWQAIPAFILGLLFGYVYYKTGSLKLTMLMHCVNNTLSVILNRIPELAEADSFADVMSPAVYIGFLIACALMLLAALKVLKGISVKDPRMGGCREVQPFQLD